MSDVSQGPGWWQASDGKWYPPELAPGYQPPAAQPLTPQEGQRFPGTPPPGAPQAPPVYQQPAYQQPVYQQPGQQPPHYNTAPPQKEGMSGCMRAFILVLVLCTVMALGIGACTVLIADDVRDAVDDAVAEAERIAEEAEQAIEEAEQAAEEAGELVPDTDGGGIGGTAGDFGQFADFAVCQTSSPGLSVAFVNATDEILDYRVTVELTDDEGGPAGTEVLNIPAVNPGEAVLEVAEAVGQSATGCEISEVSAVGSPNDIEALADIGPCEATFNSGSGVLQADVTNSTGEPATYEVLAAVVEPSGTRHGVAIAAASVEPGETASLDFTNQFANLLPVEFLCEIRTVQRSGP